MANISFTARIHYYLHKSQVSHQAFSFPMAHECSMEVAWNCTSALLFLPPSRRACARQLGRAHGRWRGLCSLLLFLLSDPSGSSDSLHYGSPSVRSRLHSRYLLSVRVSLSPPRSLVSFLFTGANRGPAGSKVLPFPQPPDDRVRTCLLHSCCYMDQRPSVAATTSTAA